MSSLMHGVDKAGELLGACKKQEIDKIVFTPVKASNPCPVQIYPSTVSHKEKIRLLEETDKASSDESENVKHVSVDYFDTDQRVTIANTDGEWAEDRRVTSRIRFAPTLVNEMGTMSRWSDYVKPMGFEAFDEPLYIDFARRLVRDIRDSMYADEAPSGYFPVVLDAGACGTFFHEACGHQLESQSVASGNSIFVGKIGQQIGSEKLTVIDDGRYPGLYGSAAIDDEGMPRQRNVLIENGILKSFLVDRLGSRKLNVPRTGSGRRQGYAYAPAARMSNTYLDAGPDDDDEMIKSLPEGLFVTELGGGTGGSEFTLMANKAYLIKNGKIERQVKGAMLTGKGAETLFKIDRVGKTLKTDDGGGFCGGASGLCPTTAFQPRIRVMGMVVGGKGQ